MYSRANKDIIGAGNSLPAIHIYKSKSIELMCAYLPMKTKCNDGGVDEDILEDISWIHVAPLTNMV